MFFRSERVNLIQNSDVEGDLQIIDIKPLRTRRKMKVLGFILGLVTLFMFQLLCRWFVSLKLRFYYEEEEELCYSTHLLVTNSHGVKEIHKLRRHENNRQQMSFRFRHLDYYYKDNHFQALDCQFVGKQLDNSMIQPLTTKQVIESQQIYGLCQVIVPIPTVLDFLEQEMTSPLYFIQYISTVLFLMEGFIQLPIMSVVLALATSFINYVILRKAMVDLQKKADNHQSVLVCRMNNDSTNNVESIIIAQQLVPGDIIIIQCDQIMSCDCILIQGEVLVDEQTLSGESIPISKIGQQHIDCLNIQEQKQHMLFDGTRVLYQKNKAMALVLRTGYLSYKGQIFRNALYPKPPRIVFFDDAVKFLLVLAVAVLGLYFGLLWKMVDLDYSVKIIMLRLGDAIIWILPPTMVIVVNLSMTASLRRLSQRGVYATQPQKNLESSQTEIICFDKTGTLTTNSIMVQSVLINDNNILRPILDQDIIGYGIMGACHQVYLLNNTLHGDSLDIAMVEYSGYTIQLDEEYTFISTKHDEIYCIIKIFEFSSELQCMGCIVKYNTKYYYFTKGSPEKIQQQCSSVPNEYNNTIQKMTLKGFRVLCMASKEIPQEQVGYRIEQLQNSLQLQGLIIFENELKDDTCRVISNLRNANLKLKIVSGDHILSTVQCGMECGIIDINKHSIIIDYVDDNLILQQLHDDTLSELNHISINESNTDLLVSMLPSSKYAKSRVDYRQYNFAITGLAFQYLQDQPFFNELCHEVTIYSRMSPIQKSQMIKQLQTDCHVAMIGDGSNDCHALKQANIGISFSSADASTTAAFTSKSTSIQVVEEVLIQGKATSANVMEAFKYYMIINVTKYVSAQLMMYQMQNFNNQELLYLNYFSNIPIIGLITITGAANKLTNHTINTSMMSIVNIVPLAIMIVLSGLCMLSSYLHLYYQPWYNRYVNNPDENTYIFYGDMNTQQFMTMNIYFLLVFFGINTYQPFKLPLIQQPHLYIPITILLIFGILMQLIWMPPIDHFMSLTPILQETGFQLQQLGLTIGASVLAILVGRISWLQSHKIPFI